MVYSYFTKEFTRGRLKTFTEIMAVANKYNYTKKYLFFDYSTQQDVSAYIVNIVICHDFEGNK